ncbi:hypothetical protein GCM10011512_10180 [Tersicoccus solisilvae]|uniref:Mechanosensitive ion channel MscS domain-containing protein n=1 Tax=Tersicoccus solisilvae TaxID=1882339 RepID=A0ABQ1NUS4_9MICC|nr:mechanosensitive ion channel domain-containing protein [Tersicoccus solisilvae]GGC85272.1 hypothetical protein GCM10011512_10180 [Tersicoccus solisilvae]
MPVLPPWADASEPLQSVAQAADHIDVVRLLWILGVAAVAWLVVRMVINVVVSRIRKGSSIVKRGAFTWATPSVHPEDQVRRAQRAETIGSLLKSVAAVIICALAITTGLEALGWNIAPLLASVSIAGVAIGFGAQQLIRDFIAGIFLTIEDQFGIGDVIQVGTIEGRVEAVSLRITRLVDDDGTIWYLRNGEMLMIGNKSQGKSASYRRRRKSPIKRVANPRTAQQRTVYRPITDQHDITGPRTGTGTQRVVTDRRSPGTRAQPVVVRTTGSVPTAARGADQRPETEHGSDRTSDREARS